MPEPRKIPTMKISEDDVFVTTHFERDNRNVDLYLKVDGTNDSVERSIHSWTDDEVDQAVEDGFLSAKDWTKGAYEYVRSVGILDGVEKEANERLAGIWNPVLDAAEAKQDTDVDTEAETFVDGLPKEIVSEFRKLPYGMQQILQGEAAEILERTVGWQIVDIDGNNVHGDPAEPFGLCTFEILIGEAVTTAREWAAANEGYGVARVGPNDIEQPEYVAEIAPISAAPGF